MAQDTLSFEDRGPRSGGGRRSWLVRAMQSARPLAPPSILALPTGGEIRLGRGTEALTHIESDRFSIVHLQTDDERMSTSHARLVQRLSVWMLEDQDSKNGTYVDEKRVTSRVLEDADRIEIGGTMFIYRTAHRGSNGRRHREYRRLHSR